MAVLAAVFALVAIALVVRVVWRWTWLLHWLPPMPWERRAFENSVLHRHKLVETNSNSLRIFVRQYRSVMLAYRFSRLEKRIGGGK